MSSRMTAVQENTAETLSTFARDFSEQVEIDRRIHAEQLTRMTARLDELSGDIEHKAARAREMARFCIHPAEFY